jgi:hypothetical protein
MLINQSARTETSGQKEAQGKHKKNRRLTDMSRKERGDFFLMLQREIEEGDINNIEEV